MDFADYTDFKENAINVAKFFGLRFFPYKRIKP